MQVCQYVSTQKFVGLLQVSVSLDDIGTYAYRVVSTCFIMGQPTLCLNRQKACSRASPYCRVEHIFG